MRQWSVNLFFFFSQLISEKKIELVLLHVVCHISIWPSLRSLLVGADPRLLLEHISKQPGHE